MGMFDNVIYEAECPYCKQRLDGFQSKSGPCALLALEPKDVRDFYTNCDRCGAWVEFEVITTAFEVRLNTEKTEPGNGKPTTDL